MMNRKQGFIEKDFSFAPEVPVNMGGNEQYMAEINQFSRRELNPNDVYVFPVSLCNNDIDRDGEQFTVDSLNALSELFVGKTFIKDHQQKTDNQCGRIFHTSVDAVPGKKNKLGEDFYSLNAMVYILNNDSNKDLIGDIDAGIKKEVSVGCAVASTVCSICGRDYYRDPECNHYKGEQYDGKTCYAKLEQPIDAYETSFVSVPAQKEAGVTKAYEEKSKEGKAKMFEYKDSLKDYGIDKEAFEKLNMSAEDVENLVETVKSHVQVETPEVEPAFISKAQLAGIVADDATAESVIETLKEDKAYKDKAEQYDKLFESAVSNALKDGVRAKGENFKQEKWEKILRTLTYEEVLDQSKEWQEDAEKALNAGKRVSEKKSFSGVAKDFDPKDYNF